MPKYIPIADDLYIVEQPVKIKKAVKKRGAVNHIWIYDRSLSMSGLLPELTDQLTKLSQDIPKGDSLTLGWFSSEGEHNFILKGFKIHEKSDYKILKEAIKKNSRPIGLTCFSEILHDVETVINDLSILSKIFSLHFFTDGYPVVYNLSKETSSIFDAIDKIKGSIHSAMMVGYGYYYNKELMSKMCENLGAALIHSSVIPEYSKSITRLVEMTKNMEPKEEVELLIKDPLAVYTVADQGVMLYTPDKDGKLFVSPLKDEASRYVYYISTKKPDTKKWKKVDISEVDFGNKVDSTARSLYAAALVLTQKIHTDKAMEILGKVGDVKLIDSLTNAFTIEEYGDAEYRIAEAMTDTYARFSEGRNENYLPKTNAFCILDLVSILMDDEKAAFYPYDKRFKYEKISAATEVKSDYPKFKAHENNKCPFDSLSWHKSRLNLSVKTRITGTVDLLEKEGVKPGDVGFSNPYPTYIYRNYSIVKDGRAHMKKLYVTSSEDTYRTLKREGVVREDSFEKDQIYAIDLGSLPTVNRSMASGKASATELCKLVMEEQKICGILKSLKWFKKDFDLIEEGIALSKEQIEYLKSNGINADRDGSFNPPTTRVETSDMYIAKSFEIKIKGMATLPTVIKVKDKMAANKSRTPVETLIEAGINEYTGAKKGLKEKEQLKWLNDTIGSYKKTLGSIRKKIQEDKFKIILGKSWFEEFDDREKTSLDVEDKTYNFVLKEEQVAI